MSIAVKAALFVKRLRNRQRDLAVIKRSRTLDGMPVPPALAENEAVRDLRLKFDLHIMEQRRCLSAGFISNV